MQPVSEQPNIATLGDVFFHSVDAYSRPRLLSHLRDGRRVDYSTEDFRNATIAAQSFFRSEGIRPGERVALLCENQPEWHITDFALHLGGQVCVPVYPTFSVEQVRHVLAHSGAVALIVSSAKLWEKVRAVCLDLPALRLIVAVERWPDMPSQMRVLSEEIARHASGIGETEAELRAEARRRDPQDLATIVYTSGTTGAPKGAMLTHRNIVSNLDQCLLRLEFRVVDQALAVLPLAHVFERLLCYGYFRMGVPFAYGDPHDLSALLSAHRPVVMAAVPRILEKIRELVVEQIEQLPQPRRGIAQSLLRAGLDHGGSGMLNHRPHPSQWPGYAMANLLVFSKVRRKLGGRLQHFICGGARLDPAVERFFFAAGFNVVQGYGLTETSPVIALTPYRAAKPGTVGKPLDALQVKFSGEGEILVRGDSIMTGYYSEPDLTNAVFEDGWFRTGDLGTIDADGYLVITGRCKEILVTSGGKNVRPAAVEEELHKSPYIARAFVVGDGRKYVAALLVPETRKLLRAANLAPDTPFEDFAANPAVRELLSGEIERLLGGCAEWERVKQFEVVDESILADADLMTPTQKLRRSVLERKYRHLIDGIYERYRAAAGATS